MKTETIETNGRVPSRAEGSQRGNANVGAVDAAKAIAAEIGFDLQDLKTGGGSDGNFTGALGIPTLDGLGADGHGAHSYNEFIYYSSLVERAKLMYGLLRTLT